MNTGAVHLLWTGGLDSTFRMLELVTIQKRIVQPHYLIDAKRRSTAVELLARDTIQRLVREQSPECADRLLPTSFHSVADLRPNPALTCCYDDVRARLGMGNQHHVLALLADELHIRPLEICNHRNDPAVTVIQPFMVQAQDGDGSVYYHVPEDCSNRAVYELFKFFRFPLGSMDKRQLLARAGQYGLLELLAHTWFCHKPLGVDPVHARACGTCNTCIYRINTAGTIGFGFRSLLRYRVARLLRPRRIAALRRRQGLPC